ncbi:MAG: NAD(P)-dependent oxidoreductase [Myxococcota bacterium]|nr:NAD(P)-dependent oxidoreductase [Myxococcota bacterium]
MKIAVTGGAGFIGRSVVLELLAKGHEVVVIDDLSKPADAVPPEWDLVRLDLTRPDGLREAMSGCARVVHLAAKIGGIGYFHRHPALILSDNNRLYSNVFEAAAELGMERMVYVSSSMVFESATSFPSAEADLASIPPPITAYGCSKLVGEWYCRAFREEHGLPYTILRPFNAYGINELPGDDVGYAHVIPDLVKKTLFGGPKLEILGDGKQTRCFTHVSDLARGIAIALEHPAAEDEDFNLGSDRETTMLDLARLIHDMLRPEAPFEPVFVPGFEHDIRRRVPDVSKAERLLGFRPEVSLEQGLPEVVQWIAERRELFDG